MKQVIRVEGKAKQVFKYIDVLCRAKGNVTVKELSKNNGTSKIDLRR